MIKGFTKINIPVLAVQFNNNLNEIKDFINENRKDKIYVYAYNGILKIPDLDITAKNEDYIIRDLDGKYLVRDKEYMRRYMVEV